MSDYSATNVRRLIDQTIVEVQRKLADARARVQLYYPERARAVAASRSAGVDSIGATLMLPAIEAALDYQTGHIRELEAYLIVLMQQRIEIARSVD